jgi:Dynamin family
MSSPASQVGNMADPMLLNKIDKLFASGVGEYVFLPQIVAVGDQSSGKSSVLEALTGLPFPRDSGLCTRFATQIRFCRAPAADISISIIPANGSSEEHVKACKAWGKSDLMVLDRDTFSEIMKEVRVTHVGCGYMLISLGPHNHDRRYESHYLRRRSPD